MEDAERIATIERYSRSVHYPEPLIAAVTGYLSGQGSLAEVQEAWQADEGRNPYALFSSFPRQNAASLEMLDQRLVDIYLAIDHIPALFRQIGWAGPVEQVREYLLSRGLNEERILEYALKAVTPYPQYYYYHTHNNPTMLSKFLIAFLPTHFEKIYETLQHTPRRGLLACISLLLFAQPPLLDKAEQLAQQVQDEQDQSYSTNLGLCAQMLLQADPARFAGYARKIAGPESPGTLHSRRLALEALLKHDKAQHIDLAVEAAHTPPDSNQRWHTYLQTTGLSAAFTFDPVKYRPLAEEMTMSRHPQIGSLAVRLLAKEGIEQARPVLQRCVAEGQRDVALEAVKALLKEPWDGQQEYALSLLAHPAKRIRSTCGAWLAKQGESVIEGVALYLSGFNSEIRLSAAQALLQVGGERARVLLMGRLEVEKSQQIRQVIIDGLGLPGYNGPDEAARSLTTQRLTAKSEVHFKYLPKPILAWLDLAEAPALRWTKGAAVPPAVLNYLLYRQSRSKDKQALDPEVQQALALIDCNSAGTLALKLFRGWLSNRASGKEQWLLPLLGVLADDRLVPLLSRQIEEWGSTPRRALAAQMLRTLAQMESSAAHSEIETIYKLFKRGYMRRAAKAARELAAAS